ncbi:hypothetical protein [Actinokineospora sp. NBRC 105648]|uniref:COG1470 family protein n=1 Tax=Actinokineospora sp. NBRC 105648 TaxID=3032206 RepID=UPI00255707E9|nr:hypothetical protein [Actinokineospora sp. NBRC 105648]
MVEVVLWVDGTAEQIDQRLPASVATVAQPPGGWSRVEPRADRLGCAAATPDEVGVAVSPFPSVAWLKVETHATGCDRSSIQAEDVHYLSIAAVNLTRRWRCLVRETSVIVRCAAEGDRRVLLSGNVHNEHSGDAHVVLQVGSIQGGVTFTLAQNRDIELSLRHKRREARLVPGVRETFYLTVTNTSQRARSLDFAVRGAVGLEWQVATGGAKVEDFQVGAGESAHLSLLVLCKPTEPVAGSGELAVVATDKELGNEEWWASDVRRFLIEEKPGIALVLLPPERKVTNSGLYRMRVRVENLGNSELCGILRTSPDRDGFEHPDWLDSRLVNFIGEARFHLIPGQGGVVALDLEVLLPHWGMADKVWHVPFFADLSSGVVEATTVHNTLEQVGIWREIPVLLRRARAWSGVKRERRRGVVLLWGLLLFLAGVFGSGVFGAPKEPLAQAPRETVAAEPGRPQGLTYAPRMESCEPGTVLLVLESLTAEDLRLHGQTILDYDAMVLDRRAAAVPALRPYRVQLSRRQDLCQVTQQKAGPAEFTDLVSIGPVPAADGLQLCSDLGRSYPTSCIPVAVA